MKEEKIRRQEEEEAEDKERQKTWRRSDGALVSACGVCVCVGEEKKQASLLHLSEDSLSRPVVLSVVFPVCFTPSVFFLSCERFTRHSSWTGETRRGDRKKRRVEPPIRTNASPVITR